MVETTSALTKRSVYFIPRNGLLNVVSCGSENMQQLGVGASAVGRKIIGTWELFGCKDVMLSGWGFGQLGKYDPQTFIFKNRQWICNVSIHPSNVSNYQKKTIQTLLKMQMCDCHNSMPLLDVKFISSMDLLPDTRNCGCACAGNAGNVFPVTAGERSRHASRHVRHARAVMHAGIVNYRFPLKSAAGENVPGIPGACATCNFTYLVRGPCRKV